MEGVIIKFLHFQEYEVTKSRGPFFVLKKKTKYSGSRHISTF